MASVTQQPSNPTPGWTSLEVILDSEAVLTLELVEVPTGVSPEARAELFGALSDAVLEWWHPT